MSMRSNGANSEPDAALGVKAMLDEEIKSLHGDVDPCKSPYLQMYEKNVAALCISGGGIRSAAFGLGVIQALASTPFGNAKKPTSFQTSLLGQFRYLSTVSGGGYIGSFLTAWLMRDDTPDKSVVFRLLTQENKINDQTNDITPLDWLRNYSNYLTPRTGLLSPDVWAGAMTVVRNMILNWLVFLPALFLAVLAVNLLLVLAQGLRLVQSDWLEFSLLLVSGGLMIWCMRAVVLNRPTSRLSPSVPMKDRYTDEDFIKRILACLTLGIVFLSASLECALNLIKAYSISGLAWRGFFFGFGVYAVGWVWAKSTLCWYTKSVEANISDGVYWSCSGGVAGAVCGLAIYGLNDPSIISGLLVGTSIGDSVVTVLLIYGVPFVMLATAIGEMIFVGLTSYQADSDMDREWFARAAGIRSLAAFAWLGGGLLVLVVPLLVPALASFITTGTSGLITAFIGASSHTPAVGKSVQPKGVTTNSILNISAPLFGSALVVLSSYFVKNVLIESSLRSDFSLFVQLEKMSVICADLVWLVVLGGVFTVIAYVASSRINVNRFSLHAFYRNRLIRAFLGASNSERGKTCDPFSNFATRDNPRLKDLWSSDQKAWNPFHVINVAVNDVEAEILARQERKAASFTFTPLHSGSPDTGYRPSEKYGDRQGGVSLGTAIAISGAAASPNMGYHSSPGVSFLMALFNVRLGWWLGNPSQAQDVYTREGPSFALRPLLAEMFGHTTLKAKYVYLSDGGHFENLGLYEMVRRRCRVIVVSDAGCDPNLVFEDLGAAVRKIRIDLGIEINIGIFEKCSWGEVSYRRGTIHYNEADDDGTMVGYLLIVKPQLYESLGPDISSYKALHEEFPQQPTSDQWFDESQFESYRSLGFQIATEIFKQRLWSNDLPGSFKDWFDDLPENL